MKSFVLLGLSALATAETGIDGWLRYAPLPAAVAAPWADTLPSSILLVNATGTSNPIVTAGDELRKGLQGIFSKAAAVVPATSGCNATSSIVVATASGYTTGCGISLSGVAGLKEDGFWIDTRIPSRVVIVGQNERGALYGAFEYLSMLAQGNFTPVAYASNPAVQIRWGNSWDNMDDSGSHGSVERGYAGPSIFFARGGILANLTRVSQYGRLLASVRINGIVINNVNANAQLLNDRNIDGVGRIADALRPYGVRVGMSLNFASPQQLGGLSTFDPLNSQVISWWNSKTQQIYRRIPDFAGYLVKANSEGQPGPITYRRTLADGANLFAKALKPFNGVVLFRAFVYDQLNYNDLKADRANAAVNYFKPLDGRFDDNVVVQIKYGPIDFQVREPVSPLFANLAATNVAIELQITQEYFGQQAHLVYLAPMWRELLDFDLRINGEQSQLQDVIQGWRSNGKRQPIGGFAGVLNVGSEPSWLGHHLAMSNFYAFGRLAWNPRDDPQSMLADWTRLTFGLDPAILGAVTEMSMLSWPAYENYTGNLGLQTLTDITGNHYGPNPASQDGNGWGQYTRADRDSIGMDRSVRTGTGNAGQYPPEVAAVYENRDKTPENLLLWFHHLPYTYKMKTGETVIQHFYNAHYAGAETAQRFHRLWATLNGKIDDERFSSVLYRLRYQAGHAIVWRDFICNFYRRLSSIADETGRVGRYPYRIEAESMQMSGYSRAGVTPSESASGGSAVTARGSATLTTRLSVANGTYDVAVNYFDVNPGKARWELRINDRVIGQWVGDIEARIGKGTTDRMDGHSAARMTFEGVEIGQGDTLRVTGTPNGNEGAPLDYVSILPAGVVD